MEAQNGLQVVQVGVDRDAGVQGCVQVVQDVQVDLVLREAHHEVEEVQEQNKDLPVSSFPLLLRPGLQIAR